MNMTSLIIKQARITKTRKGKYEYARLVVHKSKDLLKYVGREVTVMIVIKDEGGENGNEN
jgi:stalled ribosome alternative rescue factor ArfA